MKGKTMPVIDWTKPIRSANTNVKVKVVAHTNVIPAGSAFVHLTLSNSIETVVLFDSNGVNETSITIIENTPTVFILECSRKGPFREASVVGYFDSRIKAIREMEDRKSKEHPYFKENYLTSYHITEQVIQ